MLYIKQLHNHLQSFEMIRLVRFCNSILPASRCLVHTCSLLYSSKIVKTEGLISESSIPILQPKTAEPSPSQSFQPTSFTVTDVLPEIRIIKPPVTSTQSFAEIFRKSAIVQLGNNFYGQFLRLL